MPCRVETAEQKAEAELLARQVHGVVQVRSLLQVMPDTKRSESRAAAEADATSVGVDVMAEVARLSGTVRRQVDRLSAAVIARATPGTRAVLKDVTVQINA